MSHFLNRRRLLVGGGLVVVFLIALGVGSRMKRGIIQPIAFNHKVHAGDLGLECSSCHTGVETSPFATLPSASICLGCHASQLSDNPEEGKVRNYGEDRGEIPWQRLTRQPEHVYFSHQRHVTFGKISCERCHGKMAERTKPPGAAPLELFMDDCLECHKKQGASQDCISCHR